MPVIPTMPKGAIALCGLLAAASIGGACARRSESEALVERGWHEFDRGDKQQALALFRGAVRRDPEDLTLRQAYEDAMIDLGLFEQLKGEYEKELAAHPQDAAAYFRLARLDDDIPESKRLVQQGLRLRPGDPWLSWLRQLHDVQDLSSHGRLEQALEKLESLRTPRLERGTYRFYKSSLLLAEGRLWEAMQEAENMEREDRHSPAAFVLRSALHVRNAELDEALRDLSPAAALGDFASVHQAAVGALWQQGRIEQAKAEARRALASPRDNVWWADYSMGAAAYLGDTERTESFARLALRLAPDDNSARAGLVGVRLGDGKLDEAETLAREALAQNPSDEDALGAMGQVQAWRGRYAQAAETYAKALEKDPRNYGLLMSRGISLVYNGQCDEGETVIKLARRWAPASPDVERSLAGCALSRQRYGEAIEGFRRALRANPQDVDSYEGIAVAHFRLKQYAEGQADLQRALAAAPNEAARKLVRNMMKEWRDYAKKSATESGEGLHPPTRFAAYTTVKALDLNRLLAYQSFANRIVGAPWKVSRPLYRSNEPAVEYGQPPQWSADGRTLYFADGDLVALDLGTGTRSALVRRPPGSIKIDYGYSGGRGAERLIARSVEVLSRAWYRLRYRAKFPSERDRAISNARLSRDGSELYFMVDASSGNSTVARIESVRVDGSGQRVVIPYERQSSFWRFDYDRGLDRLLLRRKGRLFLADPRSGEETEVPGDLGFFQQVSFSPDGAQLVFAPTSETDAEISVVDLRTGSKRALGIKGAHPAWSPDGRRIAYIVDDAELRLLDLKTGTVEAAATSFERDGRNSEARWRLDRGIAWSPDSRWLVYSLGKVKDRRTKTADDLVWLLADTRRRQVWQAATPFENPSWSPVPAQR